MRASFDIGAALTSVVGITAYGVFAAGYGQRVEAVLLHRRLHGTMAGEQVNRKNYQMYRALQDRSAPCALRPGTDW